MGLPSPSGPDLANSMIFKKICPVGRCISALNPLFHPPKQPHEVNRETTGKIAPVSPYFLYRFRKMIWGSKFRSKIPKHAFFRTFFCNIHYIARSDPNRKRERWAIRCMRWLDGNASIPCTKRASRQPQSVIKLHFKNQPVKLKTSFYSRWNYISLSGQESSPHI
jgi:hypothetical protein